MRQGIANGYRRGRQMTSRSRCPSTAGEADVDSTFSADGFHSHGFIGTLRSLRPARRKRLRHVRLNDSRHPIHGHFSHKRIGMFHRQHQTLQNFVEINLLLCIGILEVLIVHQELRKDGLKELDGKLSYRRVGIRHHGENSSEKEVKKFQYGRSDQFFRKFAKPRERQLLGRLMSHVNESGKHGNASVGREGSAVDGDDDDFFELFVEEFRSASYV
mmetsp:Transcript_3316/g.6068  ORF Transcript_3316/g.6068 Transcript_3316/m.6068 type:complete len:216 (+) Transcript_3316:1975-2622(+)